MPPVGIREPYLARFRTVRACEKRSAGAFSLHNFNRLAAARPSTDPPPERMMMSELPPLPEPKMVTTFPHGGFPVGDYFHVDQLRAYAHAAVLAEREECAARCDSFGTLPSKVCAAAIRARGE